MKRSTLLICFMLVVGFFGGGQASAAQPVEVVQLMMDGKVIAPDVLPLVKNGRTLVPVRVIAEGLGAEVAWNQATLTATIRRDGQTVTLRLNDKTAYINGKAVRMETPPVTVQQRMLLPLRFVGEALGATVGWEESSRMVVVNRPIALTVNEVDATSQLKPFFLGETVYLPVAKLAEYLGVPGQGGPFQGSKKLEGQAYLPVEQAESLLDARISWDREENRVEVKRETELEEIETEAKSILLATSRTITPKHFTMQGPHRIVLDLPHSVLSEELINSLSEEDDEKQLFDRAGDEEENGEEQEEQIEEQEEEQDESSQDESSQDDFEDAESSESSAEESLIKAIRYSQYTQTPNTVRVVIELNQKSKYTVEQSEDGLEIKLDPIPRKTGYLIVVDAGHGGKDRGATGVSGNMEKDFNLNVSRMLMDKLKQYPEFQPVATRSTDVFLELAERVEIANEREADLFISIHANSFKPTTRGTETFYYNKNSASLANVIHRHLLSATQFPDRKAKTAGFYVIKHTKMPAVLTETGFLSNYYENEKLKSPAFQQKVADALAAAIREYYLTIQ